MQKGTTRADGTGGVRGLTSTAGTPVVGPCGPGGTEVSNRAFSRPQGEGVPFVPSWRGLVLALGLVAGLGALASCARTLDDDLCSSLSAKGRQCQDPLFTTFVEGMCASMKDKPVADLKILDRYLDMSCADLPTEFRKDMKASLESDEPGKAEK